MDEAVARVVENLSEMQKASIAEAGDDYSVAVHFGSGLGMRNQWGLWKNSPLACFFKRLGIFHADDMSGIINKAISRRVRGAPLNLDQLVKHYRDFWEKQDIVSPLDLACPCCGKEMVLGYEKQGFSRENPQRFYFSGVCSEGHRGSYYHREGWRKSCEVES